MALTQDQKQANFDRLIAKRLPAAIKAIELVANLSRPATYAHSDEQARQIADQLRSAATDAIKAFHGQAPFELDRPAPVAPQARPVATPDQTPATEPADMPDAAIAAMTYAAADVAARFAPSSVAKFRAKTFDHSYAQWAYAWLRGGYGSTSDGIELLGRALCGGDLPRKFL